MEKNFFEYSILEKCNKDDRFKREQFYVNTLNPEYNMCIEVVNNPPLTENSKRNIQKLEKD